MVAAVASTSIPASLRSLQHRVAHVNRLPHNSNWHRAVFTARNSTEARLLRRRSRMETVGPREPRMPSSSFSSASPGRTFAVALSCGAVHPPPAADLSSFPPANAASCNRHGAMSSISMVVISTAKNAPSAQGTKMRRRCRLARAHFFARDGRLPTCFVDSSASATTQFVVLGVADSNVYDLEVLTSGRLQPHERWNNLWLTEKICTSPGRHVPRHCGRYQKPPS